MKFTVEADPDEFIEKWGDQSLALIVSQAIEKEIRDEVRIRMRERIRSATDEELARLSSALNIAKDSET